MGYRSQVLLRIESPQLKDILLEMALVSNGANWSAVKQYWEPEYLAFNDTRIELSIDNVKWYDDYKEVIVVEKLWSFMASIDDENHNIDGCYMRIGEEDDDINAQYIGEGWELGHINTYIETDHAWDFGEKKHENR